MDTNNRIDIKVQTKEAMTTLAAIVNKMKRSMPKGHPEVRAEKDPAQISKQHPDSYYRADRMDNVHDED